MMWKIHSVLYCACVWLATVESRQYRFDYTYDFNVEGWLKFHVAPTHFQAAFMKCKAEGAVLASPLNENFHEVMLSMYKASSDSCGMYTGIHATITKEDFASIEGVPLAKIPVKWAPGEPDNYENMEQCIIMMQNGTFADVRCNSTYPYICYRKEGMPLLTSCGTVDKEYKLDARTGNCYKFHRVGLSWRRAQMTCMAEGGYLAIINSDVEKDVLKDLFAQYPSNLIFSSCQDVAAIGFYDLEENGVWYTVHGETLAEAGYSAFGSGQPDNDKAYDGGSHCGGMFRDGLLDDLWCDSVNLAFICEKDADSLLKLNQIN